MNLYEFLENRDYEEIRVTLQIVYLIIKTMN